MNWFWKKKRMKIEYDKLNSFSGKDIITQIYAGKKDGIVIQNFLSKNELERVKNGVNSIFPKEFYELDGVLAYPQTFAKLAMSIPNPAEYHEYFRSNAFTAHKLKQVFNLDLIAKLENTFKQISSNKDFITPKGADDVGNYSPITIRVLTPNVAMHTHCGNFFQSLFKSFYQHLETKVDVFDQLSFFMLIEPPETGGELLLFDLRWEEGQKKKEDKPQLMIIEKSASKEFVSKPEKYEKCQTVEMQSGDLLIFAGGKIWHKVTQPTGKRNRITIGGFIGKSKTNKNIMYYWS